MTSEQSEERLLGELRAALAQAGVKLTHQRLEIWREVSASDAHPDAETIYRAVRERMPTVSLDTVYRTLWLLNDIGLVTTLGLPRDRTRFDANMRPHHHFVCTRCGVAKDFYSEELDQLRPPDSVREFGVIESTQVEARGVCRECSEKAMTAPTGRGNRAFPAGP